MRVLICGGGVIGAAAAYFLASAGAEPVLIERADIACGASGKSGGFLALDWCDGTALAPLARRSFALHAELADAMPGRWGYRRVTTLHLRHDGTRGQAGAGEPALPSWLAADTVAMQCLGTTETTAQLDPGAFTRALATAAVEAGGSRQKATVTDLCRSADGRVTGVIADGQAIDGDAVLIAMGPWSNVVRGLALPPVQALEGTSLVFRPDSAAAEPLAFFVDSYGPGGAHDTPEVVVRADGTVYVSGASRQSRLPADPSAVTPEPATSARLEAMIARFAPGLAASPIVARQACFRPVTRDGLPLIGPVPGVPGAFIATGHSVWGMLNAPATGELLAELITGRAATTLDPTPFAAGRPGLA